MFEMDTVLARVRLPLQCTGLVAIGAAAVLAVVALFGLPTTTAATWSILVGVSLVVLAALLTFLSPASHRGALLVLPPVRGRWGAANSPTSRVPSHGTHAYGQTFAVDLVAESPDGTRPAVDAGSFLRPELFPAFGQAVFAPADGVVVRVYQGARDHRSRSSGLALALLFAESTVRELRGPTGVLGNHVVIRLADGTHFTLAHLRRGSATVRRGELVHAGQHIADCGNSGNSTEPHLHCQRQDIANTFLALGLAWTIPGGIPPTATARTF